MSEKTPLHTQSAEQVEKEKYATKLTPSEKLLIFRWGGSSAHFIFNTKIYLQTNKFDARTP